MNCEQKDYSWEEVKEAVNRVYIRHGVYALIDPVHEVFKDSLPRAMYDIAAAIWVNKWEDCEEFDIIHNGFEQLESKGCIGYAI